MKVVPRILCSGYIRYVPLACGCSLQPERFACGRVVQEGEPGGETRIEGLCRLCAAQGRLELQRRPRALYRHAHHKSSLKPLADPFAAVRHDVGDEFWKGE